MFISKIVSIFIGLLDLSRYAFGNQYRVLNNLNITPQFSQTNFIASFSKLNKFNCIAKCDQNNFCLSLLLINENCVLYNGIPNSTSDTVTSIGSSLFIKKGTF